MLPPFGNLLIELMKGTRRRVADLHLRPDAARAAAPRSRPGRPTVGVRGRSWCMYFVIAQLLAAAGALPRTPGRHHARPQAGTRHAVPSSLLGAVQVIWDWHFAGKILPDLLRGLLVTIEATLLGYVLALVLGLVWAILRRSAERGREPGACAGSWSSSAARRCWCSCSSCSSRCRARASRSARWSRGHRARRCTTPPTPPRSTARASRTCRRGQWEAATALNLPRRRVWLGVVLPQAVRRRSSRPSATTSSRCSRTRRCCWRSPSRRCSTAAYDVGAKSLRFLEPMTIVGMLFVLVSVVSSLLLRRLEAAMATTDSTADVAAGDAGAERTTASGSTRSSSGSATTSCCASWTSPSPPASASPSSAPAARARRRSCGC